MNRLRVLIVPALFTLAAGMAMSIVAINVALGVLLGVLALASTADERRRFTAAALPLAPWLAAVLLAWLASDLSAPSDLRGFFPWVALPLAAAFLPVVDRRRWAFVFFAALAIASILGILQHLHGTGLLDLGLCRYARPTDHGNLSGLFCGYKAGTRARGFFYTPMTFGAVVMFGLLAFTVFLQDAKRKVPSGVRELGLVYLAALLVTSSRNAWLGLVAGLPVALGRHKRAWAWALVGALLAGGMVAVTPVLRTRIASFANVSHEPSTSTGARLFLWQDAWAQFTERPLLGWGPGTFRENVERRHPDVDLLSTRHAHSNYLHALAETGAVGLAAMLFSWGWLLLRAWRRRGSPNGRIGAAVLMSFAAAGLVEANYLDSEVVVNLLVWTAFSFVSAEARERPAKAP